MDNPKSPAREKETRKMVCPFCGYRCESDGLGAVYCGPHQVGDTYFPACQMHVEKRHAD